MTRALRAAVVQQAESSTHTFLVQRPMHPLPLRTPSLVLRHFVPEDAALLLSLNAEESTRAALPSHVYRDLPQAVAALDHLIRCYAKPGDAKRGPYVLGIEHRESARLLGHVGFSPLDGDVEVSYAIAEAARGRGYATAALVQACTWAAQAFALIRLVAVTASANLPSRRTLDRVGFRHSGDETMRFQGSEQRVSRYVWLPGASDAQARPHIADSAGLPPSPSPEWRVVELGAESV